jgi:DNA-binding response OmpR family regulator
MTKLLRNEGHDVKPAASVKDGLAVAAREKIDLVVSDLGLPDGSGLDLMRQLRAQYNLKGICLTGFGMDEDIAGSMEAGFCQHLTKPIDLDRLIAAIKSAVGNGQLAGRDSPS